MRGSSSCSRSNVCRCCDAGTSSTCAPSCFRLPLRHFAISCWKTLTTCSTSRLSSTSPAPTEQVTRRRRPPKTSCHGSLARRSTLRATGCICPHRFADDGRQLGRHMDELEAGRSSANRHFLCRLAQDVCELG